MGAELVGEGSSEASDSGSGIDSGLLSAVVSEEFTELSSGAFSRESGVVVITAGGWSAEMGTELAGF